MYWAHWGYRELTGHIGGIKGKYWELVYLVLSESDNSNDNDNRNLDFRQQQQQQPTTEPTTATKYFRIKNTRHQFTYKYDL